MSRGLEPPRPIGMANQYSVRPEFCKKCGMNPPMKRKYICVECRRREAWTHWSKNKRRYEDVRLRNRYGISIEDKARMAEAQGGKCAICKSAGSGKLHVDHCHESGKVRQLLCNTCNGGLGLFKDNPELMRVAAQYVEKHKSKCATT